jgi:hypothetical protein
MITKIAIGVLTVTALLVWTGVAGAQTTPPAPKVQLPSGETVWNVSGDWNALIENRGADARFGIQRNAWRMTQTGSAFTAIRVLSQPFPSQAGAGTPSLQGEVDPAGLKTVELIESDGTHQASKGQMSADGTQIVIEGETHRVTLTRPSDPDAFKAALLRPTGWRAYWRGCPDAGESEITYEAHGDKVVVRIQIPLESISCDQDVTIAADVVQNHGCRDRNITVLFDPKDPEYPFKGRSDYCAEYKLMAK